MRIALVLAYPIHHDPLPQSEWVERLTREHHAVSLLRRMGHDAELWAAGPEKLRLSLPVDGEECPIRVFPVDPSRLPTKKQLSTAMLSHVRTHPMDAFLFKGLDGAAGNHLLTQQVVPAGIPFAFIIGGTWFAPSLKKARAVLVETEAQQRRLAAPFPRIWRMPIAVERLIRMPKHVDLKSFRPRTGPREWDILTVGRAAREHDKNFKALIPLARRFRVAVAGGGSLLNRMRSKHPLIQWLGHVSHSLLPGIYNRSRVFVHPGRRDSFPRVIAEAMACGLPCAAYHDVIDADVIPEACGIRVDRHGLVSGVSRLLEHPEHREVLGKAARLHAEKAFSDAALRIALEECLEQLQ